jgi:tetratricopeptide (TPR) repeat protein
MKHKIQFIIACIFFLFPFLAFSQNRTLSKELIKKAQQQYTNGDFENAILNYSKVIELNPNDPWWWMSRGQARFKNKDTVGSMSDLNKSIQIDSNFSYGYFQRGYIKEQIGDKVGSDWDFNKSEDLKKSFFDKGRLKLKAADFKGALNAFTIALSLHPKDIDIYFELAITERHLKDNFNADIYLKKGVEMYNEL